MLLLDFAFEKNISIISDEIYLLSIFENKQMLSLITVADEWADSLEK